MKIEEFLDVLWQERATAIIRTSSEEKARKGMEAAVVGGFRILEFTMTTPGALELIKEFSWHTDLVVGAGSVLSVQTARDAVKHGAKFLVSPVADADVIQAAKDMGVAMIPGTSTPTEMLHAYRLGAPLQKLFPAPAGGPAYVRACLGPMPFLRIVPANSGVTAENAAAYLEAGAYALGMVTALFSPDDLQQEHYDRIEAKARDLRKIVESVAR